MTQRHAIGAKRRTTKWLLALALSTATACGGATPATVTTTSARLPPPAADGQYHPGWPTLGHGVERFITLQLGPDTSEHCRMVSPKFPFDSSLAYVEDKDQLAAFVRCMNHPSMQDKRVLLIGRADPRGSDDYNMKLGMQRAAAIRAFLIAEGLAPARIVAIDSTGNRDAASRKSSDYSFGYDRRVDVVVEGSVHHP